MIEPASPGKGHELSLAGRFQNARDRCVTVERHARAILAVVARVLFEQTQQVAFPEHDDVVEELTA